MLRYVVIALLAGVAGCVAPRSGQAPAPSTAVLLPGSRLLSPPPLTGETHHLLVQIRAPRDTAERMMGATTRTIGVVSSTADRLRVTSTWDPPYVSIDTVILGARTLAPEEESLRYNGYTRVYRYAGHRVWGTVQHADSAPRAFDRTFSEPVFAFSEVELLVRSLPFTPGESRVVPLFSESDEAVEHDTITIVMRDTVRRGGPAWIVRFADPAIVSAYTIGAASRAILATETRQRRTGAVLRYVESAR